MVTKKQCRKKIRDTATSTVTAEPAVATRTPAPGNQRRKRDTATSTVTAEPAVATPTPAPGNAAKQPEGKKKPEYFVLANKCGVDMLDSKM